MRSFAIIFLSPALFLILFAVTKFSENAVAANIMNDKDNVTFLIARVMEAYGGKQNIGNVKTIYARGGINAVAFGEKGDYSYYLKRPQKLRVEIRYTHSSELRILDDGNGYDSIGGAPITRVRGIRYLAMVFQYRQIDLPYGLLGNVYKIRYEGKTTLNGIKVEILSLDDRKGPSMKIYIDTKKFFIRKVSGYFSVDNSNTSLSVEFADFRKIDGTVLPYKIMNFAGGQKIAETVIAEYKLNGEMKDSLFNPVLAGG
jgi:hypothetical protein